MKNTKTFTLTALFLSILLLLSFTPLGFIPLGPMNATTMHIPVILASVLLGPKIGAGLGGIFGLISLLRATFFPNPLSFVFSPFIPIPGTDQGSWQAILIAFLPRICIGILPYFIFKSLEKIKTKKAISLFLAGVAGSLVNTILVMNMIYFLFQQPYAQIVGKSGSAIYTAILAVILTSGIPEAILAGLITSSVGMILLRLMKNNPTANL